MSTNSVVVRQMIVYTNNEMRNLKIKEALYILRERYLEYTI